LKTQTAFVVALAVALAGCATEAERPAPAPVAQTAPEPVAPKSAPEPKTLAAPETPKRAVTLNSTELFEFDRAALTPHARAQLDEVVGRAKDFGSISSVHIEGHADPLGSAHYNQSLSEKRAAAVQAYLVSRGFEASRIHAVGSGETHPVKSCPDHKNRKALVECLAPNRRVVVEVKGTAR